MIKTKFKASAIHFLLSAVIASAVLALVYLGWYRGVLSTTEGVGEILLIMLGVDVILGPVLTFIVFRVGKKSLKFDLSVIAFLQLSFLAYGLYTVQLGRPAFIVFAKDRFESVAVADWPESSRALLAQKSNENAVRHLFVPSYIAVTPPIDPKLRSDLMFEAIRGGPDLQHRPEHYSPLIDQSATVIEKSKPLSDLKRWNPNSGPAIEEIISKYKRQAIDVRFLPFKGKREDATVLVQASDGSVLDIVLLKPWD
jgi:hypothetical protein